MGDFKGAQIIDGYANWHNTTDDIKLKPIHFRNITIIYQALECSMKLTVMVQVKTLNRNSLFLLQIHHNNL